MWLPQFVNGLSKHSSGTSKSMALHFSELVHVESEYDVFNNKYCTEDFIGMVVRIITWCDG